MPASCWEAAKATSSTTPLIMNVLVDNENITAWHMDVVRVDQQGNARLLRTVDLVNPDVCGVSHSFSAEDMREREHVAFCYETIRWTWQDGGITAEDDWETPVAAQ